MDETVEKEIENAPYGYKADGEPRKRKERNFVQPCTARSKRTGQPCKNPAVLGSHTCRFHGGHSPKGIASAKFKTGKYSQFLPARLSARYERALKDPDLLAMREAVALVEARAEDLLSRLDTGEAGAVWKQMHVDVTSLSYAMRIGDRQGTTKAYLSLLDTIKRGEQDYATWNDISKALAQLQSLKESERRRMIEAKQVITSEQAFVLIGAIISVVKDAEDDPVKLNKMMRGIAALMDNRRGVDPMEETSYIDG